MRYQVQDMYEIKNNKLIEYEGFVDWLRQNGKMRDEFINELADENPMLKVKNYYGIWKRVCYTIEEFVNMVYWEECLLAPGSETSLLGDIVTEFGETLQGLEENHKGETVSSEVYMYWLNQYIALEMA